MMYGAVKWVDLYLQSNARTTMNDKECQVFVWLRDMIKSISQQFVGQPEPAKVQ